MDQADKDQRYVEYHRLVAAGVPKAIAAQRSGYHRKYRPRLSSSLIEELEAAGVTDKRYARRVREGMDAKTDKGEADHRARVHYLNLISRLKRYELPPSMSISFGLNQYSLAADPTRLANVVGFIEAEITKRAQEIETHPEPDALGNPSEPERQPEPSQAEPIRQDTGLPENPVS